MTISPLEPFVFDGSSARTAPAVNARPTANSRAATLMVSLLVVAVAPRSGLELQRQRRWQRFFSASPSTTRCCVQKAGGLSAGQTEAQLAFGLAILT